MVNYSTNINKTNNYLSPEESLNSDGQLFTNINKTNNYLSPEESLNSDDQLFYQYQQDKQLPLTWRKLKQWWSIIPPISTKQTITSHLKKV